MPNWKRMAKSFDSSDMALVIQQIEHERIHAGQHYFFTDGKALGAGEKRVFLLTPPPTPNEVHLVMRVGGIDDTSVEVWRGTTGATAGTGTTAGVPQNSNQNSINTSMLGITIDPATIATAGTVQLFNARFGANKVVGNIERTNEVILKYGTPYLIRITSNAAGNNILTEFNWYEK